MIKYLFLCFVVLGLGFSSCSSSSGIAGNAPKKDKEAIIKLKDGVLLVRLYVLSPKIEALQKLSNDPQLEPSKREKAEKQLTELIEERKAFSENIIKVFKDHYNYSEVYFIPDSLFKAFHKGQRKGVFYNTSSFEIDDSMTFQHDHYIIFATGKPEYKYSLLDKELNTITRPKRYHGVFAGTFISSILPFVNNQEEARIKSIQKLNDSFHKTWENYQSN